MKNHPILFSPAMVRAILDGRKTQTRRVVTPQPPDCCHRLHGPKFYEPTIIDCKGEQCPGTPVFGVYDEDGEYGARSRYEIGHHLWVRESFDWVAGATTADFATKRFEALKYRADGGEPPSGKWSPSIHMPRWASRITLEVTAVRVQRVQEISEDDAMAEGVMPGPFDVQPGHAYRDRFCDLWNHLNANRGYGWNANPWVWCVTFQLVEADRIVAKQ